MSKKVLIISYHFPPDLSVGAIRPAKFAKHLPESGWSPVVLTVAEKYHTNLDLHAEDRQDSLAIYKTLKIPNFRDVYLYLKKLYFDASDKGKLEQAIQAWAPSRTIDRESLFTTLKRYVNSLGVWFPDDKNSWIAPATVAGLWIVHKHDIDVIFTTSPPDSVHWIGLLLKTITRKPWITDFRDPWCLDYKPYFVRSALADYLERWIDAKVIEKSDGIVSVTPEMTEAIRRRSHHLRQEKFHTLFNGYDTEELVRYHGIPKHDSFTITYTGSLYNGRDPRMFLSALAGLINDGYIDHKSVQVQLIGDCRFCDGESIQDMAANLNLQDVVQIIDAIPHDEALHQMARSHVLLLLAPDQPLQIPGKAFEYMGLGASILAVCGPGATENVLRNYPKAVIVPPDNPISMRAAIADLFQQKSDPSQMNVPFTKPQGLERKRQAEDLAGILDAAACQWRKNS